MKKFLFLLTLFCLLLISYSLTAQTEYDNIALGKPVGVSSTYQIVYPGFNAVDGDEATVWGSATKGTEWIFVDLGEPTDIDGIRINWYEPYYASTFRILYFDVLDQNQIHTQLSVTDGNGGTVDYLFKQRARYFGVYCTKSNSAVYAIRELEILVEKPAQDVWAKGYLEISFINAIAQAPDGSYAAVGQFRSETTDWTACIAKFDQEGNPVWAKELGGTEYDGFDHVLRTDAGNYLALGASNSLAGGNGLWIVSFDDGGTILAQHYINNLNNNFYSFCKTTTGEIIIASTTPSAEPCIIKLDADGTILWQKTSSALYFASVGAICAGDNGEFMVGFSHSPVSGGLELDYLVMKFSGEGDILWQKNYGGPEDDRIMVLHKTNDGFIIGGETRSFGATNSDSLLIKIDPDGNIIWQNKYDLMQNYESLMTITSNKNGGLIFAISGTIINADVNGIPITSIRYPRIINSILNVPEYGFIAGGSQGSLLMRLDDNGQCGTYGTETSPEVNNISVTVADTMLIFTNSSSDMVTPNPFINPISLTVITLYPTSY